jgi:hypothetical protein
MSLHENQTLIVSKNAEENLDAITKEYKEIKLQPNRLFKKKIKYNNPEDYDKEIEISCSEPIVKIKTEKLKLDYKSKFLVL